MGTLAEQIDRVFHAYDRPTSPGCSVAVIHNRATIYTRGYGMANLEYGIPITPQTVFHVASLSKQFTAMAVTMLAQVGKLDLDAEARKYVPELPDFGCPITVRQLLHHTSGLRDQWDLLTLAGWRMDDVITTQDVMDLLTQQTALNFEPGTEYSYSNSGYTLAGVIVERVSGKSLRQFAKEFIFDPLGMRETHFHDDHAELVGNRAYSYEPQEGGGFKHAVLSYATVGATSLFSTVEDLARWDNNFYAGTVGGSAILDQLQTPGVLNNGDSIPYSLGLVVNRYRGLRVVEHSGADAGFRAHLLRFPDERFSVVILSNLSVTHPSKLARLVADCCLAETFSRHAEPPPAEDQPRAAGAAQNDLEAYVGVYYNPQRNESQSVGLRHGQLVWKVGPGNELTPLSTTRFAALDYPDLEIRFCHDGRQATELQTVAMGYLPVQYWRVTPPPEALASLREFVGSYYSPELDVTYRFQMHAGQLCLRRRKYGRISLEPIVPDAFSADGTDYRFDRGADNSVCGFHLTTGRVRNLGFIRVEQSV